MWMKIVLIGFIATSLLSEQSLACRPKGVCESCVPSCTKKINNVERRLHFFDGSLFYFEEQKKGFNLYDGELKCEKMFENFNGWGGYAGYIASFQTKQQFDFIAGKLEDLGKKSAIIGGIRNVRFDKNEWIWRDGSIMNKKLVPSKRPEQYLDVPSKDELWLPGEPRYWQKKEYAMEIDYVNNRYGLNDIPLNSKSESFVCRVPCQTVDDNNNALLEEKKRELKVVQRILKLIAQKMNWDMEKIKAVSEREECLHYSILRDSSRQRESEGWYCDYMPTPSYAARSPDWIGGDRWYRVMGPAGRVVLNLVVGDDWLKVGQCGTNRPGYLKSRLPEKPGQSIDATFVFQTSSGHPSDDRSGKVTNCGSYYVYKLPNPPGCSYRYCTSKY